MPEVILDDRSGDTIAVAELLAEATGRRGKKPRWTELRLWRTPEGLYAVEKVGVSMVRGERDRRSAWTCGDESGLRKTLGKGPLSYRLLQCAGMAD